MMDNENITGFFTYDYDCKWWVGCVVSKEEKTDTGTHGPSPLCTYPTLQDWTSYEFLGKMFW
jgi:hypothetical protein